MQGNLLSAMPRLEIDRFGASAPAGLPPVLTDDPTLLASGLRVLGPHPSHCRTGLHPTLGALGADVLRIDSPHMPDGAHGSIVWSPNGARCSTFACRPTEPVWTRCWRTPMSSCRATDQAPWPVLARARLLLARHPGLVVVSLSAWSEARAVGDPTRLR